MSDIHENFEYIIKNRERNDNPPIRIYVIKIKHRITFKIRASYYHCYYHWSHLLKKFLMDNFTFCAVYPLYFTPGTIKLLGSSIVR